MKKNKILNFMVLLAMVITITSCQSREEKIISRLNDLYEHVEENAEKFDSDDWSDVFYDLEEIHKDMNDCEFSKDELKEVGRAEGKLTAIITKEGSKALGRGFSSMLEGLGSYMEGFQESAIEEVNDLDLSDIEDKINSALEELEEALED